VVLNCYIDESGDEGINTGGTRWFILGALIVPKATDLQTSTMVPRIKDAFGKPPDWTLRWSDVRSHDKRLRICQELLTESWEFSCVAADKEHPMIRGSTGLRNKWALYNYATRLLLERLSWYARDHGGQRASLTFEHRRNMDYDEMLRYLTLLRSWTPPTATAWDYLDWKDIRVLTKGKNRLLQAADCLCGAVGDGLEYSPHGFLEPRYILSLGGRLYRRGTNLFSYGLKFLHANAQVLGELRAEYDWLDKV